MMGGVAKVKIAHTIRSGSNCNVFPKWNMLMLYIRRFSEKCLLFSNMFLVLLQWFPQPINGYSPFEKRSTRYGWQFLPRLDVNAIQSTLSLEISMCT